MWLRTFAIATMQLSIATPINYLHRKWNRGNSDHLLQPFYNWLRYHLLFATISVLRTTKHFAWQKSDLLQLKVQLVAITPPIATKSCRCDKKAWHKGQKLVVSPPSFFPAPDLLCSLVLHAATSLPRGPPSPTGPTDQPRSAHLPSRSATRAGITPCRCMIRFSRARSLSRDPRHSSAGHACQGSLAPP